MTVVGSSVWIIVLTVGQWFGYVTFGFVADALSRAHIASWTVTLFVLLLFEIWIGDNDVVTALPAEFFLQTALALMLATFSVVFLVLSRADSDEGDWAEPRA